MSKNLSMKHLLVSKLLIYGHSKKFQSQIILKNLCLILHSDIGPD